MPFYCDIGYEDRMLDAALTEPAEVSLWTVSAGMMLSPKDEIAILVIGDKQAHLHIRFRFRCRVDRVVAEPGERLHLGGDLLSVTADGEEILEGYRYCFLL